MSGSLIQVLVGEGIQGQVWMLERWTLKYHEYKLDRQHVPLNNLNSKTDTA